MSKTNTPQQPDPRTIYRRLKRWFERAARTFPWRGETDPYKIWVSEIILIQTTVVVARTRYPRFLKRFPTLQSLAGASTDAVMKEWEGLGYYHRARLLHSAARVIANEHGGRFPQEYDSIRALPGIGHYAAAAIHNFCFGGRRPPLDANVARVAARLFAVRGDVRSARVRQDVYRQLEALMTTGRGSVWTDSLMDLGASVCLPRSPRCGSCPLRSDCAAFAAGIQSRVGLAALRNKRRTVDVACGIIRRSDGRILIAQRLDSGLLPNLWEFPGGKRDGREALAATCRREIMEELDVEVDVGAKRMVIRHAYSHYAVRLHVFECLYRSGRPRKLGCQNLCWVRVGELTRYAFPAANRRIIDALLREA